MVPDDVPDLVESDSEGDVPLLSQVASAAVAAVSREDEMAMLDSGATHVVVSKLDAMAGEAIRRVNLELATGNGDSQGNKVGGLVPIGASTRLSIACCRWT